MVATPTLFNNLLRAPNQSIKETNSNITMKGDYIYAVGDLHGDIDLAIRILQHAKLINDQQRWIGGKNTLVQTGDLFDRGVHCRELLDLFKRLQQEAKAAGGQVINMLGNHELIQYQYHQHPYTFYTKYINDLDTFADCEEDRIKLLSKDGYYGQWIKTWPVVVRESKTKTIFVHGGLIPEIASIGMNIINDEMRKLLDSEKPNFNHWLLDSHGPLWYRGYNPTHSKNWDQRNKELKLSLDMLDADKMVVGHTFSISKCKPTCYNQQRYPQDCTLEDINFISIDCAMSYAYGGHNCHGYITIDKEGQVKAHTF